MENQKATSNRRHTHAVRVGDITIGGGAPVVVQSMTNTDTADAKATAEQALHLWQIGSELVRITVNTPEAARAVPDIFNELQKMGWQAPLLVGDFHYNGHQLLTEYPECAQLLAKYRINPGNVGFGNKHDKQFSTLIDCALKYDKPVRIGVNWGSLDQDLATRLMDENAKAKNPLSSEEIMREALIQSALLSAAFAQNMGMSKEKIVISCKVSKVPELVRVYEALAARDNYALHLGLTEAGMGNEGVVATTAALSILLSQGIGDTIRASLTPQPGADRAEEVRVCQTVLQSLGLRAFSPMVTACPGCGRTTSHVFQNLAMRIQQHIRTHLPRWKATHPGVVDLKIAVMGCVVNGPGESKHADIGISLPGTGEAPAAPVFVDGKKLTILRGEGIADAFIALVEAYIQRKYQPSHPV